MNYVVKCFVFLFLFVCVLQVDAQSVKKKRTFITNIENDIQLVKAEVLYKPKTFSPNLQSTYFWFKDDKINETKGGYSGRLLHGSYTVYYADGNLKEKGKFRNGRRTGTWTYWNPGGKLSETVSWCQGMRWGKTIRYNDKGEKTGEVSYTKNLVNGKSISFKDGKVVSIKKYKKGVEVLVPDKTKAADPLVTKETAESAKKDAVKQPATSASSEKNVEKKSKTRWIKTTWGKGTTKVKGWFKKKPKEEKKPDVKEKLQEEPNTNTKPEKKK